MGKLFPAVAPWDWYEVQVDLVNELLMGADELHSRIADATADPRGMTPAGGPKRTRNADGSSTVHVGSMDDLMRILPMHGALRPAAGTGGKSS